MTFSKVRRMLADIMGVPEEQIAPGTHLARRSGIGAISLAKFIIRCERAFRITILDEDAADFVRVADISDYIDARIADGRDDYAPPTDAAREAWYYE